MRTLMTGSLSHVLFTVGALLALTLAGLAQERDRGKTPDKYKWNLDDL